MKVRMTVEVDLGDSFINYKDDEERMWAENEIFIGDGSLILHSNEIGDCVGEVTKVSNLTWVERLECIVRQSDGVEVVGDKDDIIAAVKNNKHTNHYLVKITDNGVTKYIESTASKQPLIRVDDNHLSLSVPICLNHKELEAVKLLNATATIGEWINQR